MAALEMVVSQAIKGGLSSSFDSTSSSLFATKGGQAATTTTNGFSKFREAISAIQQRQQQQVPIQTAISQNTVTSSQLIQRPQQIITQSEENFIKQTNFETTEQQTSSQQVGGDAEPTAFGSVQGKAGVDFPAYTSIPNTKFSCIGVPYDPGMYADESTGCQVYHLCYQGRKESFLCGVGTVFNQAILNCDFWYSVECSKSSQFHQLNANFGLSSSEPSATSSSSSFGFSKQTKSTSRNIVAAPLPPIQTVIQQNQISRTIDSVQQHSISPVISTNSIESSSFSSSFGGKISPPRAEFSSATLQSFGSGKVSLPKEQQISQLMIQQQQQAQRQARPLSPGQRVALQNQGNQFVSESSNRVEIVKNNSPSNADDNLISDQTRGHNPGTKSLPTGGIQASVEVGTGLNISVKSPMILTVQANKGSSDNDLWKPVFKSKTPKFGVGSVKTLSSTTSAPTSPTDEENSSSAVIKPDQEPVFSDNNGKPAVSSAGNATTSEVTSSEEIPKVPKSGPPPTEPPQTITSTSSTTPTPVEEEKSTSPTPESITESDTSSSSTSSPKVESTTTSNNSDGENTTKSTDTTTTTPPPPATTTTLAPEDGEATNETGEKETVRKKKKRQESGSLTSSVEYTRG